MGLPYGWTVAAPEGWRGDPAAFAWDERGRERVRRCREADVDVHRLLPRFEVSLIDAAVDRMLAVPAGHQCFGVRDAGRVAMTWESFDAEETGAHDMFLAEVAAWLDLVLPHHADPTAHWGLAALPPDGAGATRYPAPVVSGAVDLPAALADPSHGLASLGFDLDAPRPDGTVRCMLPPGWRAGVARWSVLDGLGRERIGPDGAGAALRTRFSVAAVLAGTALGLAVGLGHGRALAAMMDAGVPVRHSTDHAAGDAEAAAREFAKMVAYADGQRPDHRDPHAYWSSVRALPPA